MRLLVTNDDGIDGPGLHALVVALAAWAEAAPNGEVRELLVVAPDANYSGASSSVGDVFSRDAIAFRRAAVPGAAHVEAYAIDAAPALCTIVACRGAFGPPPDLVVSGINLGVNVGRSVLHSGTIGAVLTGGQLGLSGLAVSIQATKGAPFADAARVAVAVLDELVTAPPATMLNLNVPALALGELRGVRRGRISTAGIIKRSVAEEAHPPSSLGIGDTGAIALNLGAATPELGDTSDEEPDDDGALIAAGYASLTKLRGISEDVELEADLVVRRALDAVEAHLAAAG
jgi:5'-nucleotidase